MLKDCTNGGFSYFPPINSKWPIYCHPLSKPNHMFSDWFPTFQAASQVCWVNYEQRKCWDLVRPGAKTELLYLIVFRILFLLRDFLPCSFCISLHISISISSLLFYSYCLSLCLCCFIFWSFDLNINDHHSKFSFFFFLPNFNIIPHDKLILVLSPNPNSKSDG